MAIVAGSQALAADIMEIKRWTLNKLKLGAGAGADPTEIGIPVTSGSYTGDASVNRAIAHGLGAIPSHVFISRATPGVLYRLHKATAVVTYMVAGAMDALAVTAMSATNFYVGNATNYTFSANGNDGVYQWTALI